MGLKKLTNSILEVPVKRIPPAIFVLVFLFLIPGCLIAYFGWSVEETVRYRLEYEIENEGKVFSSSNVFEIRCFESRSSGGCEVTGESFPIRISNDQFVFPLVGSKYGDSESPLSHWEDWKILISNFETSGRIKVGQVGLVDSILQFKVEKPAREISFETSPVLVHLNDLRDPETMQLVDPQNPSSAVGGGFKIVYIGIEFTDDFLPGPQIANQLPWLNTPNEGGLVTPKSIYPFHLSRSHFIRE